MIRLLFALLLALPLASFAEAAPCGPGGCGVRARAAVRIRRAAAREAARVARAAALAQRPVVVAPAPAVDVQIRPQ